MPNSRHILFGVWVLFCACGSDDLDQNGLAYPAECSVEKTNQVTAPVVTMAREALTDMYNSMGPDLHHGVTLNGMYYAGVIYISSDLGGWKRLDTLRHERCHALLGKWHQ